MEIEIKTYQYKNKIDLIEETTSLSKEYRNILRLNLKFNKALQEEAADANRIIRFAKKQISKSLKDSYTLYEIRSDYLNSKRSRLKKELWEIGSHCLSKNYKLSNYKLNVRLYKFDFENMLEQDPNLFYASKLLNVFSFQTIDKWIQEKLKKSFNYEVYKFDKVMENELMIVSFLDKTRLEIKELKKIDSKVLNELFLNFQEIIKDYSQ